MESEVDTLLVEGVRMATEMVMKGVKTRDEEKLAVCGYMEGACAMQAGGCGT